MPYVFNYENNNVGDETEFRRNLVCLRCSHLNPNKNPPRCRRNVCIGLDLCWQHLEQINHIKIRVSTNLDAGKGLFAFQKGGAPNAIIFRENEIICEYIGEHLTDDELTERYGEDGTAPYATDTGIAGDNIDCAVRRGVGALINHAPNRQVNCKWRTNRNNNRVFIVASKTIRNNQELFLNYGARYVMNPPNERYSTKYRRN